MLITTVCSFGFCLSIFTLFYLLIEYICFFCVFGYHFDSNKTYQKMSENSLLNCFLSNMLKHMSIFIVFCNKLSCEKKKRNFMENNLLCLFDQLNENFFYLTIIVLLFYRYCRVVAGLIKYITNIDNFLFCVCSMIEFSFNTMSMTRGFVTCQKNILHFNFFAVVIIAY